MIWLSIKDTLFSNFQVTVTVAEWITIKVISNNLAVSNKLCSM